MSKTKLHGVADSPASSSPDKAQNQKMTPEEEIRILRETCAKQGQIIRDLRNLMSKLAGQLTVWLGE